MKLMIFWDDINEKNVVGMHEKHGNEMMVWKLEDDETHASMWCN